MEEPDFSSMEITVVGLGLIGGSFALGLKKLNPQKIWAIDLDKGVLEQAEKNGVIDKGFTDGESVLKRSSLVVICLYPELTVKFVRENLENFKQGAIITDAAGIKGKVVAEINSFLREDLDFIGGHPMTGKETSGFAQASPEIFHRANYLLTPTQKNKEENLLLVEKMITALGCNEPIRMTPARHDEIIALTSQLPHVIATALMNSAQSEDTGKLSGGSFRDATRVARINAELWSELLMENRENVLIQMDVFVDKMNIIKKALADGDRASLKEVLESADRAREKF